MDFNIYQVMLPLLFIIAVFGFGYFQKRKKNPKRKLRLVVANSAAADTGKTFERHLKSVKPAEKMK